MDALYKRQMELLALQDLYNRKIVIAARYGFENALRYYTALRSKVNEQMHKISMKGEF